jgi:hypothetical protein
MLLLIMGAVQSCTPLAQSVLESVVIGTYPATEDDVRAAERAYLAKEQELKYEMDHYKDVHPGYDEYHVEQDEIWHNPYVLIAIISAYYDGQEWDMDKAMPVIEKYFKLQYRVTEEVTTEIRYRTETQSGTRWVTDPDTGQQKLESYMYEEDVPYEYTICNVTLENYDLSHTPVISMSHHTMGMYALYMATHGNMEGIDEEAKLKGDVHFVNCIASYLYESHEHGDVIIGNAMIVKAEEDSLRLLTESEAIDLARDMSKIRKVSIHEMTEFLSNKQMAEVKPERSISAILRMGAEIGNRQPCGPDDRER